MVLKPNFCFDKNLQMKWMLLINCSSRRRTGSFCFFGACCFFSLRLLKSSQASAVKEAVFSSGSSSKTLTSPFRACSKFPFNLAHSDLRAASPEASSAMEAQLILSTKATSSLPKSIKPMLMALRIGASSNLLSSKAFNVLRCSSEEEFFPTKSWKLFLVVSTMKVAMES